jgi:hypothetical protein
MKPTMMIMVTQLESQIDTIGQEAQRLAARKLPPPQLSPLVSDLTASLLKIHRTIIDSTPRWREEIGPEAIVTLWKRWYKVSEQLLDLARHLRDHGHPIEAMEELIWAHLDGRAYGPQWHRILEASRQADRGEGTPLEEVMHALRHPHA